MELPSELVVSIFKYLPPSLLGAIFSKVKSPHRLFGEQLPNLLLGIIKKIPYHRYILDYQLATDNLYQLSNSIHLSTLCYLCSGHILARYRGSTKRILSAIVRCLASCPIIYAKYIKAIDCLTMKYRKKVQFLVVELLLEGQIEHGLVLLEIFEMKIGSYKKYSDCGWRIDILAGVMNRCARNKHRNRELIALFENRYIEHSISEVLIILEDIYFWLIDRPSQRRENRLIEWAGWDGYKALTLADIEEFKELCLRLFKLLVQRERSKEEITKQQYDFLRLFTFYLHLDLPLTDRLAEALGIDPQVIIESISRCAYGKIDVLKRYIAETGWLKLTDAQKEDLLRRY